MPISKPLRHGGAVFHYSYGRTIALRIRLFCLCITLLLIFTGCGIQDKSDNTCVITTDAPTATATFNPIVASSTKDHTITTDETTSTSSATSVVTISPTITENITTTITKSVTAMTPSHSSTITPASAATTSNAYTDTVTFKATIRDNSQQPVDAVTVTVYVDGSVFPSGVAVTDQTGIVHLPLQKGNSYRVVLSTLPTGYEANAEYRFATNTVNITIRKAAVQNELDHSAAQYEVGKMMTDFSLTDTDGKTRRLSDLLKEKHLVILNFWFTSCEPCKMEFPFFESATQKYSEDIILLAVDPIDSIASIEALRDQLGVSFPMAQDTCKLYLGFDVIAYPTTVFIDSNGRILDIHTGAFPDEAAFFAAIEKYLP